MKVWLPSQRHTEELGHCLGSTASAGDVVCLQGDLGAGKTTFARGFIRGARRAEYLEITSPTYLLNNVYPPENLDGSVGKQVPTVHHMDLWRLKNASSRSIVDFSHVFRHEISLIEWPDRLGSLLPDHRLDLQIEYVQDGKDDDAPHDDPWGFDRDEESLSFCARVATLSPHGTEWAVRIQKFLQSSTENSMLKSSEWTHNNDKCFTIVLQADNAN